MTTHQITLEIFDPDQHTGEATRAELARTLEADVEAPDEGGLFDLRVEAGSREEALLRVADALPARGRARSLRRAAPGHSVAATQPARVAAAPA